MPLQTQCTGCGALFRLADDMAGKRVRCTACQTVFTAHDGTAPPAVDEVEPMPEPVPPPQEEGPKLSDLVSKRLAREKSRSREREREREPAYDDEDRPKFPKALIIGGVGVLASLLFIVALVIYGQMTGKESSNPVAKNAIRDGRPKDVGKDGRRPVFPPPDIEPEPIFPPDVRFPVEEPPIERPVVKPEPLEVEPPPEPDDPRRNVVPKRLDPIQPPKLADARVEVTLPGPITDVRVGGAGRFIVLQMDSLRQFAIFDANAARIVKVLPLGEAGCHLAAGLDCVVVASPVARKLERWSLLTFEREASETLTTPVQAMALGSASRGPLVLCGTQTRFIDLDTLQERTYRLTSAQRNNRRLAPHFLNASADGRVFTCRDGVGGEPHTLFSLVLNGRLGTVHAESQPGSMFLPSPDGRVLYAESGIYSEDLKLTYPERPINQIVNPFLPATQGGYFMRIQSEQRGTGVGELSFYLPGTNTPIAKLPRIEGYIGGPIAYGHAPDKLMHEKRIHYIPEASLLVTVPRTNDRLVLRTFDIEQEMAKSPVEYLFVSGRPNDIAVRGEEYVEKLVIQSKKGGVQCKLSLGPPGMTISAAGEIRWKVPADLADREAQATISVTDAGGREIFHPLRLSIRGEKR